MDYNSMSTEELKALMESYEKEIPNLSVKEQAIKISINSLN